MVTQDTLTQRINRYLDFEVTPQYTYTPEEIQKATYVLVNPDDCNYQLGFEPEEEIPQEAYEYQVDFLDYDDMPLMNIFIY